MARLKKNDVERLARDYDRDPCSALAAALRTLGGDPEGGWETLVSSLNFDRDMARRLTEREQAAMDQLLVDLIELRDLPH